MKYAFLYPGQGAQFQGMMYDICGAYSEAMAVVEKAEKITGVKISDYLWNIPAEELARSDRSQIAITVAELAVAAALKSRGIIGSVFAGFSLGEFAALCSAGVLSFEETVSVVFQRGLIMQKACEQIAESSAGAVPGMAACIGLPPEKVIEVLEPLSAVRPDGSGGIAFAANMNSPKQTVVSATAEGLEQAEQLLKAAGARRFIRLKVAGPFHSPLMIKGAEEFARVLETVSFKNPAAGVVLLSNVTGAPCISGADAKDNAVRHFTNPVLWTTEERFIAEHIAASGGSADWRILEAGPGTVLGGLWRDSGYASETLSCVPVNTKESVAAAEI